MTKTMVIGFDDSVDVTEYLYQIEIPDLLHTCAPCSELQSKKSNMTKANNYNISTMNNKKKLCINNFYPRSVTVIFFPVILY